MNIKEIVESQSSFYGKLFDYFFQILIILSLITFSLETVPSLKIFNTSFRLYELIIVVCFTVEYLLRLSVSSNRLKFIFSFQGIIDLCSILPFYMSYGLIDLRVIRIFRLLRLFRAFKLLRYSRAIDRFSKAIHSIKDELVVFSVLTLFILYLSSAGIYYFENPVQPEVFKSIFHSMWWAVATLTTVGFGDIYPVTVGGKIFTFFILMVGLGVVSIPSALLASALSKRS